jgi:streptogramin lyase
MARLLPPTALPLIDPQIQGIVGPHGFAIDQQNRLWYAGRTSDVLGWVDPETGEHRRFELPTRPEIAPEL